MLGICGMKCFLKNIMCFVCLAGGKHERQKIVCLLFVLCHIFLHSIPILHKVFYGKKNSCFPTNGKTNTKQCI
jgi:hypothetical protein